MSKWENAAPVFAVLLGAAMLLAAATGLSSHMVLPSDHLGFLMHWAPLIGLTLLLTSLGLLTHLNGRPERWMVLRGVLYTLAGISGVVAVAGFLIVLI